MKKRYVYALLFGVPGFFLAGIVAVFVFGASLGLLWLYVFGDRPWPAAIDTVLAGLFLVIFLSFWGTLMLVGYRIGINLEKETTLNRKHILLSGGLTLVFLLLIVLQQWSVGNLGPQSDSALCSQFCLQQGNSGSGMPPPESGDRTCTCYDASGNEVLTVPLERISK